MMKSLALFCIALGVLGTSAAASDVLLVDSTGAGDFLDLQPAIDAAREGDTIVVRRPPEGALRFGGFVIDGKSLSLVNLRAGELATGPGRIRGLRAGQSVVLSGLSLGRRVTGGPLPPAAGLSIDDCAGAVRVQGCDLFGWSAPFAGRVGRPALEARSSADVVLQDCRLYGGAGAERLGAGGPGLVARSSTVLLHQSFVQGGRGASEMASFSTNDAFGGPGGAGAVVLDATLYASSSEIQGGSGGDAYYGDPSVGGDGGVGLRIGAAASAYSLDTTVAGGPGGTGTTQLGAPGTAVVGLLATVPGTGARGFVSPDRAEESAAVPLAFHGLPGDDVILLESTSPATRLIDPQTGYLHVGAPFRRTHLGPLPASGELTYEFTPPDAPAGEARQLVLQAVFVSPGGGARLSGPASLFVFDGEAPPVCGRRLHVDAAAAPGGDGSSWATALRDPNEALLQAADCPAHPTEVWVAAGTYRPAPANGDPALSFRLYSGTRLYGGFAGDETDLAQRDPRAHPTVFSGDLNGDDGPGFTGRDDNTWSVLRSGTSTLPERDVYLDGLSVRGGQAIHPAPNRSGGGLSAHGEAVLVGCTFTDNSAGQGGGVSFSGDSLDVVDCRLVGNFAGGGGGLYGTSQTGGRVTVVDSVIAGNSAPHFGLGAGMRVLFDCSLEVRGSIVYANYSPFGTAGILGPEEHETRVTNCILWANYSDAFGMVQAEQIDAPLAVVDHSCVQGLDGSLGGAGNLGEDPAFTDRLGPDGSAGTLDDDLRLAPGSPCVDAGRNADVPADLFDLDRDGDTTEPLPLDLAGLARFVDDPAAPDTGEGSAPIVDMGPFERQP